jgi:hypothetical protein
MGLDLWRGPAVGWHFYRTTLKRALSYVRLPLAHGERIQRLFGEERRRTKVIPLAFGERVVPKSFLHGFEYGPRF